MHSPSGCWLPASLNSIAQVACVLHSSLTCIYCHIHPCALRHYYSQNSVRPHGCSTSCPPLTITRPATKAAGWHYYSLLSICYWMMRNLSCHQPGQAFNSFAYIRFGRQAALSLHHPGVASLEQGSIMLPCILVNNQRHGQCGRHWRACV
jgi:hypothetical protein